MGGESTSRLFYIESVHLCTAFSEIPFSLAKSKQSVIKSRFARFLLANALLGSQQATAAIRKEVHFERYPQMKVARVAVVAVKHRKRRGGTQTTMKTITKGALASRQAARVRARRRW